MNLKFATNTLAGLLARAHAEDMGNSLHHCHIRDSGQFSSGRFRR